MANKKKKVVEPVVEETTTTEEVVTETVIGIVTGCDRLNVRKEPSLKAEALCNIKKDAEVQIDESGSTKEFYKICTASGINGYCMKKFISVKK